jgi:hypothetical protein
MGGFANFLVLMLTGALCGITLRNLLGRASTIGIKSGWVSMVGFAALAAWCFWRARALQSNPAAVGAMAMMQKLMILFLVGLLLSAIGVTRQRKLLRKPPAPPVS